MEKIKNRVRFCLYCDYLKLAVKMDYKDFIICAAKLFDLVTLRT